MTTAAPPAAPGAPVPRAPHPGLFISFEGGDGVGKTTQIAALAEHLRARGVEHLVTREPGGTELGAQIRGLLLDGGHVAPRAEALLYAADRAHHVETRVRPALARGAVVLTDRYLDSSVAYQGAARSLGAREVRELSLWATGGLIPDLTILLDADPALARQRTSSRGRADRLEREGAAFRAALREQFLALAAAEPQRFRLIDADQGVPEVTADVVRAVEPLLAARESAQGAARGGGERP
ncbi:dTMP kinase [Actinomyces bowdenii]|uniref:Thymidylate kinase n=1 Tax=Actinomyces bowdenii TaxID=131109 RepID=A0A853EMS4_9ACTO|nr:dTMP kinase [Actinomyces bowdenii]MBF0698366.1 dTMP kinase [Actinomyces bowdenii]NYS70538.1 dTMP kinase [Actinomyces bowdenii]